MYSYNEYDSIDMERNYRAGFRAGIEMGVPIGALLTALIFGFLVFVA